MTRIAVFGASGFVGATLVERLWRSGDVEVVPIIHSSGNAARLARFGKPLVMADALQPASLDRALVGCSHAVNCSRGPAEVMLKGLRNLLEASRRAAVQQFVHVSSVASYGEPDVRTLAESATPQPLRSTYGYTKYAQDQLVEKAAADGLPCVVLCPPNISGSYSPFLMELLQAIRRGELALVEEGRYPCELVDVENLVHAIRLALRAPRTDGRPIFITDGSDTTWADVAAALAPLAEASLPLPSITMDAARDLATGLGVRRASLRGTIKHLWSASVRGALRSDPLLATAENSLKAAIRRVQPLERALRRQFEAPPPVQRTGGASPFSDRLVRQQLRNVRYAQSRARNLLGYEPVVSVEQSMASFQSWYADLYGWHDAAWPLTRQLSL